MKRAPVSSPRHAPAARALRVAAFSCAAIAACKGDAPPPKPPPSCNPPPGSDVPVIALSAGDSCPRPRDAQGGRWDVAPVFPPGSDALPASMKRLCVYTWTGCGAREDAALPLDELAFAADDPPIVSPLAPASAARAGIVAAARSRLVRAADALVPIPEATGRIPVFIGVPDTSPAAPRGAADIALDVVPHGFDVAWVARFLACPGGSLRPCLGRVRTDLALGRAGGRGGRAELAASVVRLVRTWKAEGGAGPLVIPIAAGWEPLAEHTLPWLKDAGAAGQAGAAGGNDLPPPPAPAAAQGSPMSPGGRAVWGALHFAACHGALVIAAAGNDPGYREPPSGPMLPAAWETAPAPSAEACKAWFGEGAIARLAAPKTAYTPLVHAVAGVDDRDVPIAGTRDRSMPRLVALASLVAAFPDDHADAGYSSVCARGADVTGTFVCERTTPRTGTSMAAAVTGGIAAVVWAHRPSWSGHDVMQALYAGGVSLGEKVDVSLTAPGKDTIVRVSLCGALAAACKGAPKDTCPARLSCAKPPAFARGPRPSPFVSARPGLVPLVVGSAGAVLDPALACPGCVLRAAQAQGGGCELTGVVPAAFFSTARVARVFQPSLDLYDKHGRRLGYVEEGGFRPREWSSAEPGDQPVFANAASCASAGHVVLRWTACADAACGTVLPMSAEIPMVQ